MVDFLRDLRHSLRSLGRTPILAATVIVTVGLGIGATTAIFSVIHAVMLNPLPYPDAGRLVHIYTDSPPDRWPLSVADYRALEEQQTSFSIVAGYDNETMTFNRGDVAERVRGKLVTWTYFPLLGISPLHGRLFTESDDVPGAGPTLVVSHRFWSRHLGGDPAAIGRTVRLDGTAYTVIGVLPPEAGPLEQERDFFAAARWEPPSRRGPFSITALGRLAPEAGHEVAAAELRAINRRIFPIWKSSCQDERASWGMGDLKESVIGDVGPTLLLVLGAVGFMLLIASTNAASLLVGRATHRSRELAVRAALGASRGRLLQHLLSESAILASAAAVAGLLVALGGMRVLITAGAEYLPRTSEIGLTGPVAGFLAAITLLSGLMFGLISSLQGTRTHPDSILRSGGLTTTEAAGPRRLRHALVIVQYAVAVPLLIAAGLLIVSLARLQGVDPGFDSHNLLTVNVSLPRATYAEPGSVLAFWRESLGRVQALPGVRNAALTDGRPPRETFMTNNFDLLDRPTPPGESQPSVPWVAVTPEYFDVLGVPVLLGRAFEQADQMEGAPSVVVVDEAWARRFYPGENPVGKQFRHGGSKSGPPTTVVGVVGDVKHEGLDRLGKGTIYWPAMAGGRWSLHFIVRTASDPMGMLPSIRNVVRELDEALPLTRAATVEELIADSLDTPRYLTVLVSSFASVALLLSLVGIYGVMSYFVQQHLRDIGIRMALGGGPAQVLGLILRNSMRLVGAGILLGILGALFLTRLMAGLLYGVGTTDPTTFVAVATAMLAVSLIACAVPARRAVRVDPARILRQE